ncbi:phosphatase PAP2 family protein, partial [Streptomyces sp. NPDC006372]|uniref:phosphatase PAP2 family protein n=1 Tax=Streptomyces sp. NPDC006372 TaxID=3155599 RepID=UPI00339F3270
MTIPDLDLTTPKPGHHRLRERLPALDGRLFEAVAGRHRPGGRPVASRLSRSADHGALWFVAAAALAASRTPRARRAATRGLASLGLASLTVRTLGRRSVRHPRPPLAALPLFRQLGRRPVTTSSPSGHAASAAAFAAGAALESPAWGTAVGPVAASVALARVRTGAHFPSDVLAGAALGVGAALAVRGRDGTGPRRAVRPAGMRSSRPPRTSCSPGRRR